MLGSGGSHRDFISEGAAVSAVSDDSTPVLPFFRKHRAPPGWVQPSKGRRRRWRAPDPKAVQAAAQVRGELIARLDTMLEQLETACSEVCHAMLRHNLPAEAIDRAARLLTLELIQRTQLALFPEEFEEGTRAGLVPKSGIKRCTGDQIARFLRLLKAERN